MISVISANISPSIDDFFPGEEKRCEGMKWLCGENNWKIHEIQCVPVCLFFIFESSHIGALQTLLVTLVHCNS